MLHGHKQLIITLLKTIVNADVTLLFCIRTLTRNIEFITRLLTCEIVGLECRVITTECRTRVHCIHMFCNALVHVIYSGMSGQCSFI